MKERPILFSAPMVRAIREGRKTQTRRVMKPPVGWPAERAVACPYGVPDDRLWVREAWNCQRTQRTSSELACAAVGYQAGGELVMNVPPTARVPQPDAVVEGARRWHPSIHMPRWASRLTLEVTGVRVERVQDISREDAKAEAPPACGEWGPVDCYRELWDSLNAKRGYGWAVNPWVWVISFTRAAPPEGQP
jgi:hypothetical protein